MKIDLAIEAFKQGATLDETRAICNVSRNKIIKLLKEALGLDEYKRIAKATMIKRRIEASIKVNKGRKAPPRSKEWCEKISKAKIGKPLSEEHKAQISSTLKKRVEEEGFWLSDEQIAENAKKIRRTKIDNGAYERHSELMKTNHPFKGKKHTEESKEKMRRSRYAFLLGDDATDDSVDNAIASSLRRPKQKTKFSMEPSFKGKTHSLATRQKLSQITKQMWLDGKFDHNEGLFRSKLEKSVLESLSKYFECEHSLRISRFIYDIHIPEYNVLIEVNGDYWHFNPKLYEGTHYDKSRDKFASDVWARDKRKIELAKQNNYKIIVVWQKDLVNDFEHTIQQLCIKIKENK